MKIAVTGSSGMIGQALVRYLSEEGHAVTRVIRGKAADFPSYTAVWDPESGRMAPELLEGHDAVIHLAGENISSGRWTEERKRRIRSSRTKGTALLCETLAQLKRPPKVLLSASAYGYYGNRDPHETVDESSPRGEGFLARVCEEWEHATQTARQAGIRVVHMRFGMVLTPSGGALKKMMPVFRAGLGGRIGNGRQPISWMALDEIPRAAMFAIRKEDLDGPVNFVTPHPVSNEAFTSALARVLNRPALFPLPAAMARLIFGEMAEELLLSGSRAVPRKLLDAGYEFRFPQLEPALRAMLGKS